MEAETPPYRPVCGSSTMCSPKAHAGCEPATRDRLASWAPSFGWARGRCGWPTFSGEPTGEHPSSTVCPCGLPPGGRDDQGAGGRPSAGLADPSHRFSCSLHVWRVQCTRYGRPFSQAGTGSGLLFGAARAKSVQANHWPCCRRRAGFGHRGRRCGAAPGSNPRRGSTSPGGCPACCSGRAGAGCSGRPSLVSG
jgi:hypothetical protein